MRGEEGSIVVDCGSLFCIRMVPLGTGIEEILGLTWEISLLDCTRYCGSANNASRSRFRPLCYPLSGMCLRGIHSKSTRDGALRS